MPLIRASVCVAALLAGLSGVAHAADIDFDTLIECAVEESRVLSKVAESAGGGRPGKINSWFASWLLTGAGGAQDSTIRFHWMPGSSGAPALTITADDTVHNSVRILSRTTDSVIAATSASDSLTAESWLFTVNFRQEAVVATQVQSNVAGVKGQVVGLSCAFDREHPGKKAPKPAKKLG
jgi:hypothetical protein